MDRPRALKVSKVLLMKTTANGCTVAEATDAAEKLTEYMKIYRISLAELMGALPSVISSPGRPQMRSARTYTTQGKHTSYTINWCQLITWIMVIRFFVYLFYG
jgi:hypothetical protein